jgi:predicted transposase YbfD/YdcC
VKVLEGKALAIDGKTMRHSFDKATGQSALHQVHAWIVQEGVLLGQVATDSQSNEITAIPQLLSLLDVRGTDVSIDAMGCQKDIAKQLVDQGANYVLGLKENHPTLYAEVDALFDHPLLVQNTSQPVFEYQEENKGHGRQEKRIVRAISSDGLSGQEGWKGLKTVVRVESHRTIDNRKTVEFRYYLSSIAANEVERISRRIRGHWTVENSLHWSLDVQMREDESRIRMGHGAENFGILRRLALIVLKHDKTIKRGLKAKQKIAGWNNDTLLRFMISEIP